MKKYSAILLLLMFFIFPTEARAAAFSDVPADSAYYEAISYLSDKGIITGYDDNTFRPEKEITRAEAATLISRAAQLEIKDTLTNAYTDVDEDHWGYDYIMSATKADIVNGVSEGIYSPNSTLTHYQILTMIVRMLGQDDAATAAGGWPLGYVKVAYENKIINNEQYQTLQNSADGKLAANRGDIAQYVYNAVFVPDEYKLRIAGHEYYLGMKADELGQVEEIVSSAYGFLWYIFGTEHYGNFFAAGVSNNGTVVALLSAGYGFKYNGLKAGDTVSSDFEYADNLYTDKNDSKKIHGVLIIKDAYSKLQTASKAAMVGESRISFHCTNAFRVYHGLAALKWDNNASIAAQLHSQDMANNDYFAHDSQDGTKFYNRLVNQGVDYITCAENIASGYPLGFLNYNAWINSAGHRRNILGNYTYLGVGGGYNQNSTYKCYFTQDFFSK